MRRQVVASWAAWSAAALACLLLALGAWWDAHAGAFSSSDTVDWVTGVAAVGGSAAVGVVLATRRSTNPIGWLLLLQAVTTAHFAATEGFVSFSLAHGDSDATVRLVANWDRGAWSLVFAPLLAIVFLFPSGPPPLKRWPLIAPTAALSFALVVVTEMLSGDRLKPPFSDLMPYSMLPVGPAAALQGVGLAGLVATFAAAAWSIRRRFRNADTVLRAQLKWLVFASALAPLTIATGVIEVAVSASGEPGAVTLALLLTMLILLPSAIGVALMRYRLFDIDIVINRTFVYGVLTAVLAIGYVAVLSTLSALVHSEGLAGVVAAVLVAVTLQPLRERLQRRADRWLHGYRSEPYEALRMLGERLHAPVSPDQVLHTIVASVSEALRVPYVAVEIQRIGEVETAASNGTPERLELERMRLEYRGETVADLVLGVPPGREFTGADRRLLADLAAQSAVAVHAVRLTVDLQHSRERMISAREEERRRVRRDLHDGLGPALASAVLNLDASRSAVTTDPAHAEKLLLELRAQMQDAIGDVRRLVYELRPPKLDQLGLVGALREHAARASHDLAGLTIVIDAPAEPPGLPAAVEVAAYRIAMEALTNVQRHASARHCTVRLAFSDALHLEVADDGIGIQPGVVSGVGMQSMQERAVELGGTLAVQPCVGGGTAVQALLPVAAL